MSHLAKAVESMDATLKRTNTLKALRTWRQRATKAALGSIVEKSRRAGK